MADLSPNEIARRLERNEGVLGPKMTITLEPEAYERNPKLVKFITEKTQLICSMLEMFFSTLGLAGVTIKWENLHLVRQPPVVKPD